MKLKPIFLEHPYHRRSVDTEEALAMSLAVGWKVIFPPERGTAPPTANAKRLRAYKQRRRVAGYRRLDVLLPAQVYDKLLAEGRDGESIADTLERMISGKCP